jgi:CheY-like chemotaxis protein
MDLQMPEMNGFEATEYIRKTLNLSIPIIALTADVTTVDLAKCKAVGMNDYIAKPIDERVLYSKIVGLVQKPKDSKPSKNSASEVIEIEKTKCINLDYLNHRTKSNPKLMIEMIGLYLDQTPILINTLKQSLIDQDWDLLHAVIHKMIPSFSIVGIHSDFENIAKKIQEFVIIHKKNNEMEDMVMQLDSVCMQACKELELELETLKKSLK